MKTLLATAFAVMVSSQAMAATPNMFVCNNDQAGVSLTYATTSLIGKPELTLTINGEAAFSADQVLETSTFALGKIVSTTVVRHIPDAPARVYSLLIPGIGDLLRQTSVPFKGVLLQGYKGGFVAPAYANRIESAIELSCTAEAVFF